MAEHIAPKRLYYFVFGSLLVLTLLTWQIAYIDLGQWNTLVALAIAILKATLVATFFMHLRWSAPFMRLVLAAALFWLTILLTLTLSDFSTRGAEPQPAPWHTSAVIVHTLPPAGLRR